MLVLAVVSSGGRAHPSFADALRGWCKRAAESRCGSSSFSARALHSGLCYRVCCTLSVQLQLEVHGRLAGALARDAGLSRQEAGVPSPAEAALAAAWAEGDPTVLSEDEGLA